MGSEQSSSRREYREPGATARDVEKALEQQRKMYEKKMKKLLEESQRSATTTTAPSGPLGGLRVTAAHQQQAAAPAELLERQRNPYSYNQNELHSPSDFKSGSLYPNLGQAGYPIYAANLPQGNVPVHHGAYGPQPSAVFVNSNYQYQHTPPQQPQRNPLLQPSAPPPPSETSNTMRSRSQSRQRGGDNDVNCPTCKKMYGERIYQCNAGHSSCDLCKTRQVPCGQCRQQITDRRNYDLEKYLLEKRVKCPNFVDGCRLYIKMGDMAIHEKECPFKALQCPSLGSTCTWTGKMSQLEDHFNEMHPLHNQGEVDKEMFMSNIINTSHTMHYIRIGNFNFLFHVKVSEADGRIYMAAQLIGTKHSAAKWDYEIHMYNKSQPRRKYQYSDMCSSASDSLHEIISSTKCAVIPQEYAKTFVCNGSVAYKFYIKRDDFKTESVSEASDVVNKNARRGPQPQLRKNFKKYVKKN